MGAWGHGNFDNDDAMDWISELEGARDFRPITRVLDTVLRVKGYLESPDASVGLAAAEVVAALLGQPSATLPPEVTAWVRGKPRPQPALIEKAQRVARRVRDDSELRELWAESEDTELWQHEVDGLLMRLAQVS